MAKKKSLKKKPSSNKNAPKKKASTRPASKDPYNFPKITLEAAIRVAKALEDKFAGKPTPADDLVLAVGFNKSSDWRFLDLLRGAEQYGLTSGTGATSTVKLEQNGLDIVAPQGPNQRRSALDKAFRSVELFNDVANHYKGKKIPEDEFFENTLTREFDIIKERVGTFISVFTENLNYLKSFNVDSVSEPESESGDKPTHKKEISQSNKKRVRDFLGNCFVIMPFGNWYDRYYKEIYIPSIKDAGLEPVRADELFTTGAVIEQIWEEIGKADVLLAELSGKNANVFYELGLAHAISKPVVFITRDLEDVPFDLRHLRVISYDVREPRWAESLGQNITTYLRSAQDDPLRSIPQPFRPEDELNREEE